MRYLWFGAFVLSTICIGVYYTYPIKTTEKGKAMGPYRFCANLQCTKRQALHKTQRLTCAICGWALIEPTLEDLQEMDLPEEEDAALELAARYFALMQRCNQSIDLPDALSILALEDKYDTSIVMQKPLPPVSITTQEQVQPSIQACIDVNRLKFGRYLVQTGRISEWED